MLVRPFTECTCTEKCSQFHCNSFPPLTHPRQEVRSLIKGDLGTRAELSAWDCPQTAHSGWFPAGSVSPRRQKGELPCRAELQISVLETLGLSLPFLQNCSTALLFRSSMSLQERKNEFPRGQPTWWMSHRQGFLFLLFFFFQLNFLGTRTAILHQPCRHHHQGIHWWI